MAKIKYLFILIICLGCFKLSFAETKLHPDMFKLKTYRSYWALRIESTLAEQFDVWVQLKDQYESFPVWKNFHIAIKENQDVSQLKKKSYLSSHNVTAGFLQPPKALNRVPVKLKTLEAGIIQSVKENYKETTVFEVLVNYLGKWSRVKAYEVIPISINKDVLSRSVIIGENFYFIDYEKKITKDFGSLRVGNSSNKYLNQDFPEDADILWVDYLLPMAIEGTSLFSLEFSFGKEKNIPQIYKEQIERLKNKMIETVRENESTPSMDHSIETVLLKQSNTLLPEGFRQYLEFKINLYGRAENFQEQLDQRISFLIPVSDKPFQLNQTDKVSGFSFQLKGTLKTGVEKPELSLKVTANDGSTKALSFDFDISDRSRFQLIKDDTRYFIDGALHIKDSFETKLEFPGVGKYTSFDICPDGTIYPYKFTGKGME